MHLLLIEDDLEAAKFLQKGLQESGYVVSLAVDGRDGLKQAQEQAFDLLITDRMLPHLDGLALVRALREQGVRTPVLVLSALGTVDDRVLGLKAGGDDYLTKPFAFSELLARVDALLRRSAAEKNVPQTRIRVVDLEMDLLSRSVTRAGKEIQLTAREFKLLEFLMRNSEQVLTRTMIFEAIWGYHFDPGTNLIDVHLGRLRRKIDTPGAEPLIRTIRGSGYALHAPA